MPAANEYEGVHQAIDIGFLACRIAVLFWVVDDLPLPIALIKVPTVAGHQHATHQILPAEVDGHVAIVAIDTVGGIEGSPGRIQTNACAALKRHEPGKGITCSLSE